MTASVIVCPLPSTYSRKTKESHTARYCKLISCQSSKTLWAQTLVSACSTSPFAPWELLKKHQSFKLQMKHRFYLIVLNLEGFGWIWDWGHQKNTQSTIYPVWWTLQVSALRPASWNSSVLLRFLGPCIEDMLSGHKVLSPEVLPEWSSPASSKDFCVSVGMAQEIFVHPSHPSVVHVAKCVNFCRCVCVFESLSLCI